jgi:hypothetical protein
MRRVLDRDLPEPFRSWIDPSMPLPEGVVVLPRSTNVTREVLRLLFPGLVFAGLGVLFIALVTAAQDWVNGPALACLALNSVLLFSVPLWRARRLAVTLRARSEERAGVLRRGILVGADGMLIRVVQDHCYLIPLGRFVRAKMWDAGVDDATEHLGIEVRHGRINVPASDLAVGVEVVKQAIATARRRARYTSAFRSQIHSEALPSEEFSDVRTA